MNMKSALQSGVVACCLVAAGGFAAFADDYGPAPGNAPRYDSQIEETRSLNLQALDDALEQNEAGGVTVEDVSMEVDTLDDCEAQGSASDASCAPDDEDETYEMPGPVQMP